MHVLLMYSPHSPSEEHVRRLESENRVTEVTVASSEQAALHAAPTADVILGHRYLRQVLPQTQNLQWVQSTTQGTDRLPRTELARQNVRLTRYTGSAPVVARHAVALAWAVTRRIPPATRQQASRQWSKDLGWLPLPERAIVFGTGSIGQNIARLLQGQGLSVTGVKRTVEEDLPHFNSLHDRYHWRGALTHSDWCFLALPHTSETRGMIDDQALAELPSHAVVVNVGRGEALDLDALASQLREEQLGGAALDVLPKELEPLSPSSSLWEVPHLLVTPHVAAYHPHRRRNVEQFCEEQVRRYLEGEPLLDEVDLSPSPSSRD